MSHLNGDPLLALTPAQQGKLTRLQQCLVASGMWKEEKHDLRMLRRFLKARQWDLDGAQQMWMDMLEFRALNNVDRILTDFKFTEREAFLDAYPHGLHKVDRKFRPVMVYKFGAVDLDRLKAVTTDERITLFHIQECERIMQEVLPACSLASGHYVEQLFTLIDVGGLKMKDMMRVKDLLTSYIKVDSNNYPETLGAMVIINAPYWFSGMFSAIKSFLPPDTQKKVQILGANYHKELTKLVAPENLLSEFGGTSTGRLRDGIGPWQSMLQTMHAREQALDPSKGPPQDDQHEGHHHHHHHRHHHHHHHHHHQPKKPGGASPPPPAGPTHSNGSLGAPASADAGTILHEPGAPTVTTGYVVAVEGPAGSHTVAAAATAAAARAAPGEPRGSGGAATAAATAAATDAAFAALAVTHPAPAQPPAAACNGEALLPHAPAHGRTATHPHADHGVQQLTPSSCSLDLSHSGAPPPLQQQHHHQHNQHHHPQRYQQHRRRSRHAHKGGSSPRHSTTSTTHTGGWPATSSLQQQGSDLTAYTQQQGSSASAGGLPDLTCSASPMLHAAAPVSSWMGPFGCQQHQRAALEACLSWESSRADGASGLSCYHSLDTEATSAWRPPTPLGSTNTAHTLPPWSKAPEHASPQGPAPLAPLALSTHTHAHTTTSSLPLEHARHAPRHSPPKHPHHHQQPSFVPLPLAVRGRRSADAQAPQRPRSALGVHTQGHLPACTAHHLNGWSGARARVPGRGGSIDGSSSSGLPIPSLQQRPGALMDQEAFSAARSPSIPLGSPMFSTISHHAPSIPGVPDTDAAMLAVSVPPGHVTPLSCHSASRLTVQGGSLCSACSDDESKGSWDPRFSSPGHLQGSLSPCHSCASGNLVPAFSAVSSLSGLVAPLTRATSMHCSPSPPFPPSLHPAADTATAAAAAAACALQAGQGLPPQQPHAHHTAAAPHLPLPLPQQQPQASLGARLCPPQHSHDAFARASFHSCASVDSAGLQAALNTLGGGQGPGGTPLAASDAFPWLNPSGPAAIDAYASAVHVSGNHCEGGGSGMPLAPGAVRVPVHGRSLGGTGAGFTATLFSSGSEEYPAAGGRRHPPHARVPALPQCPEKSARMRRSSGGADKRSPALARLGSLAMRLGVSRWLHRTSSRVGEEEGSGGQGAYAPLLEHPQPVAKASNRSRSSGSSGSSGSRPPQQLGQGQRGWLRVPITNITSNPLGQEAGEDERYEDSCAACDWEWEDIGGQGLGSHGGHDGKGRLCGVTLAAPALQGSGLEGRGGAGTPARADSNQSLHSASGEPKGDLSSSHSEGHPPPHPHLLHPTHPQPPHPKKRHPRTRNTPNMVLPLSYEGPREHGTGPSLSSNFSSRRPSYRSSKPSPQGPRFSSSTWYGSCDENDGCWAPGTVLNEEGEEGVLLGSTPRKPKPGRKRASSIAKRVGKKILPCCFIQ